MNRSPSKYNKFVSTQMKKMPNISFSEKMKKISHLWKKKKKMKIFSSYFLWTLFNTFLWTLFNTLFNTFLWTLSRTFLYNFHLFLFFP